MRIVCMTNEGQLPMMKNMLRSAKDAGFNMNLFHCYILGDQKQAAAYNTGEFKSLTIRKLEVILENMKMDSEILWIDNDIVLFENCIENMRSHRGSFVMQDDIWSPCTGFFLARTTMFSLRAIQQSIEWLKYNQEPHKNDQHAFTSVYKRTIGLIISLLPQEEYPNGEIYFNQKKTSKAKMVHCNYLPTTPEKEHRLKDHGFWNPDDSGFALANKYYL
jgi:hypothetical protein